MRVYSDTATKITTTSTNTSANREEIEKGTEYTDTERTEAKGQVRFFSISSFVAYLRVVRVLLW